MSAAHRREFDELSPGDKESYWGLATHEQNIIIPGGTVGFEKKIGRAELL